jgi:hypothetical protein
MNVRHATALAFACVCAGRAAPAWAQAGPGWELIPLVTSETLDPHGRPLGRWRDLFDFIVAYFKGCA